MYFPLRNVPTHCRDCIGLRSNFFMSYPELLWSCCCVLVIKKANKASVLFIHSHSLQTLYPLIVCSEEHSPPNPLPPHFLTSERQGPQWRVLDGWFPGVAKKKKKRKEKSFCLKLLVGHTSKKSNWSPVASWTWVPLLFFLVYFRLT